MLIHHITWQTFTTRTFTIPRITTRQAQAERVKVRIDIPTIAVCYAQDILNWSPSSGRLRWRRPARAPGSRVREGLGGPCPGGRPGTTRPPCSSSAWNPSTSLWCHGRVRKVSGEEIKRLILIKALTVSNTTVQHFWAIRSSFDIFFE